MYLTSGLSEAAPKRNGLPYPPKTHQVPLTSIPAASASETPSATAFKVQPQLARFGVESTRFRKPISLHSKHWNETQCYQRMN